jgi:hypothetical protein
MLGQIENTHQTEMAIFVVQTRFGIVFEELSQKALRCKETKAQRVNET